MTSSDLRRLAIAFACAIALHEVLIALIPRSSRESAPQEAISHVSVVQIERRRAPRPTPTPTPTPPPPHVPVHRLGTTGTHAHIEAIKHAGSRRPTPPKSRFATPVPMVLPTGGTGAGAQNGSGAGSTSDTQGTGTGTGDRGSGDAAGLCGEVKFSSRGDATLDSSTGLYERSNIVASVKYTDGTVDSIPLDWTWHWTSEAQDPFNYRMDPPAPMLFQFPPDAQRAQEPQPIAYIIAHTSRLGFTRLTPCPGTPPEQPRRTYRARSLRALRG